MQCWLALVVLASGVVSQVIENTIEPQIKNWDNLNYLTIDCNHELFNTYKYSNENFTIFVNLCRMLPLSVLIEAKMPSWVTFEFSNIFMKRSIRGFDFYYFKNLSNNNGISVSESNPQAEIYWYLPDITSDFYFRLERGSNDTVGLTVQDFYFETIPQNPLRRLVTSSIVTMTYGGPGKTAQLSGIYNNTILNVTLEVAVLVIIAIILVFPDHLLNRNGRRVPVKETLLFWLSINFITDVTIEAIGEQVASLNHAVCLLLPILFPLILAFKVVPLKLDTRKAAELIFYMVFTVNWLLVAAFYTSTYFRLKNYILPILYIVVLPVACRYTFKLCTDNKLFKGLLFHFLVSLFIILRIYQVFEKPRGMLIRTFRYPLSGPYASRATNAMVAFMISALYQCVHLFLLCKYPQKDLEASDFYRHVPVDESEDKDTSKF